MGTNKNLIGGRIKEVNRINRREIFCNENGGFTQFL